MLGHPPGKEEASISSAEGWRAVTTFSPAAETLSTSASCSSRPPEICLTIFAGGATLDHQQPQILLGAQLGFGALAEGRSRNGLHKQLADLLRQRLVDLAIDADHAAKGGDWIGCQRLLVCLRHGRTDGRAAGVAVLDDGNRRLIKLLHQLPGGIQIDQVVVAKFFALELLGAGHPGARAVSIERRILVRVFSVAKVCCFGIGEQQGRGKMTGCAGTRPGSFCRSAAILLNVMAMAES